MKFLVFCLLLLNLYFCPVNVLAAPSVMLDTAKQKIVVNGMQNLEVQDKINAKLAQLTVVPGSVEVLANNVSILSVMANVQEADRTVKKGFTFDIASGEVLKPEDFMFLNEEFYKKIGKSADDIASFIVAEKGILLERKATLGTFDKIDFSEIISWVNVNKIIGCFNIHNMTNQANNMQLTVKPDDLLVLLLPSDRLQGYSWQVVSPKGFDGVVVELARSVIISSPNPADQNFELFIFAVRKQGESKLELTYSQSWSNKGNTDAFAVAVISK